MNGSKKWYESKAVWGGIIAVLGGLLGMFGKSLTPDTASFLTNTMVQVATATATIVGGLVAIWGRLKADKVIK